MDYVVATVKPWNIEAFEQHHRELPGRWHLITEKDALTTEFLDGVGARYVFFPHWQWTVPDHITGSADCVCFHMTDVPYGRGGSPLQNLIQRGHDETMVTALKMVPEADAGPIYLKRPISLEGKAQDIFQRLSHMVYGMIGEIVANEPQPIPQEGDVTMFTRRTPDQSVLPMGGSLADLYDHIRMLDAETYPPAFIDHGDFRLEFHDAAVGEQGVEARVTVSRRPGPVGEEAS